MRDRVYFLLMNWSPSTAKRAGAAITFPGSGLEHTEGPVECKRALSVSVARAVFKSGCDLLSKCKSAAAEFL